MRIEFVTHLNRIAEENSNLMVLDADCSRSTKTNLFQEKYPDNFINLGISEQNAIGVSAGLARMGYDTFINSFSAMLVFRAAEQIIQSICLPSIPVNIVGHYSGVSASLEGAPHHALFDISLMNSIPNIEIYVPATEKDISYSINCAIESTKPTYIRLSKNPIEQVDNLCISEHGAYSLHEKEEGEVLLVTYGQSFTECIKASKELNDFSITCGVLNITKLKPIDKQIMSIISNFKMIITVEEHSIKGGIGSLIAEMMLEFQIVRNFCRLGIKGFTETGEYKELLDKYKISCREITTYVMTKIPGDRNIKGAEGENSKIGYYYY